MKAEGHMKAEGRKQKAEGHLRESLVRGVAFRAAALLLSAFCLLPLKAQQSDDLGRMSLEELMNVPVVSASNVTERLADAPATVIVITRAEIQQRGYRDLSQIFDDLPGMDVIRPYGDTYLKNYWRGYRNTVGEPFLIMIDGVVFNHLYFNTGDIMVTFPLSDIERVEVVYGPASSVYGASAFMGVVNVITRREGDDVTLEVGGNDLRLADATLAGKSGNTRMRFAARFDDGNIDRSAGEAYEYTRNRYFADRRLWGGFLDDPRMNGGSTSPHRNRGFDLRIENGALEAALQYFRLDAGYGFEYAGDRSLNHAVWSRPDASAYLRYTHAFGARVNGTTLARYRSDGVSNDSFFVESYPTAPETGAFSYWRSGNKSWSLAQDFDVKWSEATGFRAGARWEQKDLQKAYDLNYGPALPIASFSDATYPFPPQANENPANRITTTDAGAYLQSWIRLSDHHRFNFGVREDHNSKYGGATTFRFGYVGHFGDWNFKTLFGQAFEEPNNRLLYGGWDGSGSDPRLRPERSTTIEVSAEHTTRALRQLISVYDVHNRDTFVNTVHTASNLGRREVVGVDYHAQALLPHDASAWFYYSRLLHEEERKLDSLGDEIGKGEIGDLAGNKLHAGLTATLSKTISGTLRARYIGHTDTVETNPVNSIGGYAVVDAFVRFKLRNDVETSISIDNLFNRTYFHPGIRDANAGVTPGFFDGNGVWHGSAGYYSSLLPQPRRTLSVGVHWRPR
jgi:outer membrane cobalamin receptor